MNTNNNNNPSQVQSSEWKSVNVSSNSIKPTTRVQPTVTVNKSVNQQSLQSNLNPTQSTVKPKVVNETGQGKVVDFRQQLTTTKKKKWSIHNITVIQEL